MHFVVRFGNLNLEIKRLQYLILGVTKHSKTLTREKTTMQWVSFFELAMMQVKIMGICILSQGLVPFGFFYFSHFTWTYWTSNLGFFRLNLDFFYELTFVRMSICLTIIFKNIVSWICNFKFLNILLWICQIHIYLFLNNLFYSFDVHKLLVENQCEVLK